MAAAPLSPDSRLLPCVFFDRDGIVNQSPGPGYVERIEDFIILPEFMDALRLAMERGYKRIVVTNQRCVSTGIVTPETLESMHAHLHSELAVAGLSLDGIYYCPHGGKHPDRKPAPGMLLRAAAEHSIDLAESWMIGDSERDAQAGRAAGCRTVLIKADTISDYADYHLSSIQQLPGFLKKHLNHNSIMPL